MRASERVRTEWANRVRAEYGSAALTARVLHGLIATGMPRPLIDTALRIVRDELDHAAISHSTFVALGGEEEALNIDIVQLAGPPSTGPVLAGLTENILGAFCVGETVAVPLFAAMRAGATRPEVLEALDRILRDEAVHRAFGWEVLEALIALDPQGVPAFASTRIEGLIAAARRAYVVEGAMPRLAPEERGAGLIDLEDYARIFEDCVRDSICPRFAALGIDRRS